MSKSKDSDGRFDSTDSKWSEFGDEFRQIGDMTEAHDMVAVVRAEALAAAKAVNSNRASI